MPLLIIICMLFVIFSFEWRVMQIFLVLLVSPICWLVAQVLWWRLSLSYLAAHALTAISFGVALLLEFAIAWGMPGQMGYGMWFALEFLLLYNALLGGFCHLVLQFRIGLGLGWAYRSLG